MKNSNSITDPLEKIIISEEQIQSRVSDLGKIISDYYKAVDELTIISIVNGAIIFTADLIRKINVPIKLDCIKVSSYGNETLPHKKPEIIEKIQTEIKDKHILIIDDIIDTGHTLFEVYKIIKNKNPASIKSCLLLQKSSRLEVDFEPDYIGFQIADEFVVGYGLDYAQNYRNLPHIGVLKNELLK